MRLALPGARSGSKAGRFAYIAFAQAKATLRGGSSGRHRDLLNAARGMALKGQPLEKPPGR
jgi:hypothetical protein